MEEYSFAVSFFALVIAAWSWAATYRLRKSLHADTKAQSRLNQIRDLADPLLDQIERYLEGRPIAGYDQHGRERGKINAKSILFDDHRRLFRLLEPTESQQVKTELLAHQRAHHMFEHRPQMFEESRKYLMNVQEVLHKACGYSAV